jgi:lysophospholipase L1-like esterase
MKDAPLRKLFTITLPVLMTTMLALGAGVEAWVRWRWDPSKGTPGFFESDPMRRQRLAANYTGWFAGVPVHINSLGFRDDREYALVKGPTTFRILVLGDSVTFGHGSVGEHTYPFLLEQRLKAWRPEVDWQVWNLAVPGYNTSQELAQLLQVGPVYKPDLVVIGFYENDLIDNFAIAHDVRRTTVMSALKSLVQRRLYSLELYRRVYLTLRWKLGNSTAYRQRLEHLAVEDELLAKTAQANDLAQQQLTPIERLTDEQVRSFTCVYGQRPNPALISEMQRDPGFATWLEAVRGLQALNASRQYRLVFFLNLIPPVCPDGDMFYDGGSAATNDFFVRIFSEGAPAVSVYDELRHRRPSQMPNACCHAIGNTNLVKADVLFGFLRERLPATIP